MNPLLQRVSWIALAVLFVFAFGVVGFVWIEGFSPFDAFYVTLLTVSTIGYGEVRALSHAGRIFNTFLIILGVGSLFLCIGAMATTIIELELGDLIGKRRNRKMIDRLSNHFIVCGFGRVGRGAASELQRSGAPFVVVDRSEDRCERAMRAGMLAVCADGTRDESLRGVHVEKARGVIAALATDADNLFLILSAKALNPSLYLAARVSEEEAEEKLRRAGADIVFAPYSTTGYRLAQAMIRPHVHAFLDVTTKNLGMNVGIEQLRVGAASELVSRSLRELQLRKDVGVVVLAIRKADGAMQFNPAADTILAAGDYLIVMGEPAPLRKLEQMVVAVPSH